MDGGGPAGEELDEARAHEAEHAAEEAPGHREERALDEELRGHVPAAGPEGAADAHLACPLGDARQHDVHDPDPTDEEADRGDGAGHHVEDPLGALALTQDLAGHDHLDRLAARRAPDEGQRDAGRGHDGLGRRDAEHDLVDAVGPAVGAPVERGEGHEHRAVDVATADGGPSSPGRRPPFEDAHHLVPVAPEPHRLADGTSRIFRIET